MSALAEIIAGALAIGASIVRQFVTVTETSTGATNCGINVYTAELTDCGGALVDSLITLIYGGVALLTDLVGAAAVTL